MLAVIAMLYLLFAALSGSIHTLLIETAFAIGFLLLAFAGFRTSLWIIAAALFSHGVFDFFHSYLVVNRGVPNWYPGFCLAYDVVAAGFLAYLLARSKLSVRAQSSSV